MINAQGTGASFVARYELNSYQLRVKSYELGVEIQLTEQSTVYNRTLRQPFNRTKYRGICAKWYYTTSYTPLLG